MFIWQSSSSTLSMYFISVLIKDIDENDENGNWDKNGMMYKFVWYNI